MNSIIMIIAVDGEELIRLVEPFKDGNFGPRASEVRQEFLRAHPDVDVNRVSMRYERDGGSNAHRT